MSFKECNLRFLLNKEDGNFLYFLLPNTLLISDQIPLVSPLSLAKTEE